MQNIKEKINKMLDSIKNMVSNVLSKVKEIFNKKENGEGIKDSSNNGRSSASTVSLSHNEKITSSGQEVTTNEQVALTNEQLVASNGQENNINDFNVEILDAGGESVSSDTVIKKELTEADKIANEAAQEEERRKKEKKKKSIRRTIIIIVVVVLAIIFFRCRSKMNEKKATIAENEKNTVEVQKLNISSEISGSGTLAAKDSYSISSLVEGNVRGVYFNAGDKVVKDQLLVLIDSSSELRNIETASSSVVQANDSYQQALYEYEKICEDYKDRMYRAPYDGTLKSFSVKKNDKIKSGTQIGVITNDSIMTVKLPFAKADFTKLAIGKTAYLELQETGEFVIGVVTGLGDSDQVNASGAIVRYATIECNNPGGITSNNTAIAYVGNAISLEDASFEYQKDEKISFNESGEIEVEEVLVAEGAKVEKGTPLFLLTEKTYNNVLSNKKKTFLAAQQAIVSAENKYKDAVDSYDEYFITAPISGTIISRDVNPGDKIQKSNSGSKELAKIFDLSELKFNMDVDELDISKVKVGQEVNVQADAFKNKTYKGYIKTVSLVSSSTNGVTTYPVTVIIENPEGLLPGMNVDGYIILEKAEGVLAVPADALQRGNVLYLTEDSPTIKSKKYKQEGISERVLQKTPLGYVAVSCVSGLSNEDYIEIKEGVQLGDKVYVTESSSGGMNFGGGMGGGRMGGGPRR